MTDKEKLEKLKKLAGAMYYAAQYLTTDASQLHKAMDEYHKFIIHECKEEPVSKQNLSNVERTTKNWKEPASEELEVELKNYLNSDEYINTLGVSGYLLVARHFAKWQKEQFEKNRLKHCDSITNEQAELEQGFIDQHLDKYQRMPTFLDAVEYGMRLQKEQMMKDAVEAKIYNKAYPTEFEIQTNTFMQKLKHGNNVKLIIIK